MAHGLDHAVHAVRDLDAAVALYRKLGFTVGARNRHPWGTHNHIVQLPGFFVELLTLAEPDKLGDDGFSTLFAGYARDFAARHDGLALLILESADAMADRTGYRAANIAASDTMRFEREGQGPDGAPVKVGFSLSFAADPLSPEIHFATCQQHFPENFWNPAFQSHGNGVSAIAGVVLVAEEPEKHLDFLMAFSGGGPVGPAGEGGYSIGLPRGVIDVMVPGEYARRFGLAGPAPGDGARMAALRFACRDMAALKAAVRHSGLTLATAGDLPAPAGGAVLNADSGTVALPAFGAALVFEPDFVG